jgi:hypothetical protein
VHQNGHPLYPLALLRASSTHVAPGPRQLPATIVAGSMLGCLACAARCRQRWWLVFLWAARDTTRNVPGTWGCGKIDHTCCIRLSTWSAEAAHGIKTTGMLWP